MPNPSLGVPKGGDEKAKGEYAEGKRLAYEDDPELLDEPLAGERVFPVSNVVKPGKGMTPRNESPWQAELPPELWFGSGSKGRGPPKQPSKKGSGSSTDSDPRRKQVRNALIQASQPFVGKPPRTGTNESLSRIQLADGADAVAVEYSRLQDASREVAKLGEIAAKLSEYPFNSMACIDQNVVVILKNAYGSLEKSITSATAEQNVRSAGNDLFRQ